MEKRPVGSKEGNPVIMVASVLITAPRLKQRDRKRRFCLLRYNRDALIESRAIGGFSFPRWKIAPFVSYCEEAEFSARF